MRVSTPMVYPQSGYFLVRTQPKFFQLSHESFCRPWGPKISLSLRDFKCPWRFSYMASAWYTYTRCGKFHSFLFNSFNFHLWPCTFAPSEILLLTNFINISEILLNFEPSYWNFFVAFELNFYQTKPNSASQIQTIPIMA